MGLARPPGSYPREEPEMRERYGEWLAKYEAASERYATCRFLEVAGAGRLARESRAIAEEHDRVTRAGVGLPLA
jgi:hypothetical protein